MGKLGVVFRREYLERVRSKWFLFGTLLGPVFFLLVFVAPQYIGGKGASSNDVAHVLILDASGIGMGAHVAEGLHDAYPSSPAPMVETIDASDLPRAEDRAVLRVQRSEMLGFVVLDSSTVDGKTARYSGRNASSISDIDAIRNVVRQEVLAARMEREGIDAKRVAAFTKVKLDMKTQKIGDQGREKGSGMGAMFFGYAVAMLLYMMIVLYGQTIMRGVMEEKTTRVAEVVVSSVNTDTLLAGKILGVGFVAITQVVSWIVLIFASLIYLGPLLAKPGAPPMAANLPSVAPWTAFALLSFFVLGFIFYASLFAAVGAMVNSQEDVQQAAMPVMLLLVSSVVFMGPIMTNPGSAMARTMSLIPFSAPILMPLRMTLVPVPWYEVVGSVAGVTAACGAAIWMSARVYRVGLLMYGKRPSMSELARWIKHAR